MKDKHPLHKRIGDLLDNISGCEVIKDSACRNPSEKGGAVPLFFSKNKSHENKYCNVDLLLLKNNAVKVIIEIEESDIPPIKICGKFLASALSQYYIHESHSNKLISMDHNSVLFVQVIDQSKLKEKTKKINQFKNIEKSIKNILPIKGSKITDYKLFCEDFEDIKKREGKKLLKYIKSFVDNKK